MCIRDRLNIVRTEVGSMRSYVEDLHVALAVNDIEVELALGFR